MGRGLDDGLLALVPLRLERVQALRELREILFDPGRGLPGVVEARLAVGEVLVRRLDFRLELPPLRFEGARLHLDRTGLAAEVLDLYLEVQDGLADLVQAVREVSRGKFYLSPGVSETVVEAFLAKTEVPRNPLTPRERQVLQLIAEGKTTKEIAVFLAITPKTADFHRTRIMQKLDIHEVAGLVRYAIRRGLIRP